VLRRSNICRGIAINLTLDAGAVCLWAKSAYGLGLSDGAAGGLCTALNRSMPVSPKINQAIARQCLLEDTLEAETYHQVQYAESSLLL